MSTQSQYTQTDIWTFTRITTRNEISTAKTFLQHTYPLPRTKEGRMQENKNVTDALGWSLCQPINVSVYLCQADFFFVSERGQCEGLTRGVGAARMRFRVLMAIERRRNLNPGLILCPCFVGSNSSRSLYFKQSPMTSLSSINQSFALVLIFIVT